MNKKFVPLNSEAIPSQDPKEIRTYLGDNAKTAEWKNELCRYERRCAQPGNSTISKVLTIEDELRRLHEKAKISRFKKPCKPCERFDDFTVCVVPQRTQKELKVHARMRENFLKMRLDMTARVHDAAVSKSEAPSLVKLVSPMIVNEEDEQEKKERQERREQRDQRREQREQLKKQQQEQQDPDQPTTEDGTASDGSDDESSEMYSRAVKPKIASPVCSLETIFVPPSKLLELRRPKSGLYINETEPPPREDDDIPYSTYNPRLLQSRFDDQKLEKIDIIHGKDENDLWTWNIGLQKTEADLNKEFLDATKVKPLDCNMEWRLFPIPDDLHKTFNAEIVFGKEAIRPEEPPPKPGYYNRPLEIASIYIAYVEGFRFNPDFWTADIMDAILVSADKLVKRSTFLRYKSPDTDFDIIPQITEKNASIGLKIHYTGPLKEEPNVFKALSLYFSKYHAAVLVADNMYLLIWKRCFNSYYIFDPNGRSENCQRDLKKGKCSLMATRFIEHLVHIIVNFSEADLSTEFNLYEIFLTNYGKITNPLPNKPYPKPTRRLWAVVNKHFAIIPAANGGLLQPIFGTETNPSMIMALVALLYADIERPTLWRMEVIDDLTRFGQVYYKTFTKKLRVRRSQHLNIADLPEMITMGSYRATLQKGPFLFTGHIANCRNFRDSQLYHALRDLFMGGVWESALLQIDNLFIAIWRDLEYFYAFDPFRRGKAGNVLEIEEYLTRGAACLQIHTNFDSLSRILYQKALKMRRGGKFFMHGIRVGCIKPIIKTTHERNRYTWLKLIPEINAMYAAPPQPEKKGKKRKPKVERTYSIESIPDLERIPEYDSADIVEYVLDQIICEIILLLPEETFQETRTHLYKQAEKVLFKSDKTYLERIQYDMQHGMDYDNIYAEFPTQPDVPPQAITLEDELQIAHNFETLPDGTWVIFTTSDVEIENDDTGKLNGLVSCLIAAALSAKYKISTWNKNLVNYAYESVSNFSEEPMNYEKALELVLSNRIPKISMGESIYKLKVQKVMKSSLARSLRQVLLESLINFNRVVAICQHFSCLIIKRYNFLYVFIGFPCNAVGYRKFGTGPACLLRIVELDSLIRRIEFGCNPQGCQVTNYVVVALKTEDITTEPRNIFKQWPDSDEENMVADELAEQDKLQQRKLDKIRFLDNELRKENERIQSFLIEKERRLEERRLANEMGRHAYKKLKRSKKSQVIGEELLVTSATSTERITGEEDRPTDDLPTDDRPPDDRPPGERPTEDGEAETETETETEDETQEPDVEPKHKPGRKLQRMLVDEFKPRPISYGYRLREKDCYYKIQGSTALEGRDVASLEQIKTCYFASTLAILYTTLRPLNQWSVQRVDKVIESANGLASKVTNMATAFERFIKSVTVDDYEFDIWAKTVEPIGTVYAPIDKKITKLIQTRNYFMLQTPNCTYAIYHDEYFHLFDPYGSMEKLQPPEEEGDEEAEEEEAEPPPEPEPEPTPEPEQTEENAENAEKTDKTPKAEKAKGTEGAAGTKKKKVKKGKDGKKKEFYVKPRPKKSICLKDVKRYGERNTASWVLFADMHDMLHYIHQRTTNPKWIDKDEFQLHIVDVISYKKASPKTRILQLLTDLTVPMTCNTSHHIEDESSICAHAETIAWLDLENCLPVWSRLNRRNTAGRYRNLPVTKLRKYDIEIDGRLWSLWGTLHPQAPAFDAVSRGKQFLACAVVACCAASVYPLTDWSSQLLDSIVISGDKYHRDSLALIKRRDYEFCIEDLDIECTLENIGFVLHIEHAVYGKLYCQPSHSRMNLATALMYFFAHFQYGIVQCNHRSLAIGRTFGFDGGYFMYDCQSREHPLFPKGQGAGYLLRTKHLQVLLYCIVVTLNVSYFNMQFTLHKVNMMREGASLEDDEEKDKTAAPDGEEADGAAAAPAAAAPAPAQEPPAEP